MLAPTSIQGNRVIKSDGTVWQIDNFQNFVTPRPCNFENDQFQASQIVALSDIADFSQTGGSFAAVDNTGSVFVETSAGISQITGLDQILKIRFRNYDGTYYGVVLKSDGSVWTFSTSESNLNQIQMRKISNLNNIVEIESTFAIDKNGSLWTWEEFDDTSPPTITIISPASQLGGGGRVSSIASSGGHMIAVFDDGSVRVWGQMFRNNAVPCLNDDFEFYYGDLTQYPYLTSCPLDDVTIPLPTTVPGVSVFP